MLKYNSELGQGVTDELAGVILLQYQTGAFPVSKIHWLQGDQLHVGW